MQNCAKIRHKLAYPIDSGDEQINEIILSLSAEGTTRQGARGAIDIQPRKLIGLLSHHHEDIIHRLDNHDVAAIYSAILDTDFPAEETGLG